MIPYYIIMGIIAYLIGSVNFSVLISKKVAGFDLREKGSGNAGTTNMLRTVGKKAAIITLVCDTPAGIRVIKYVYSEDAFYELTLYQWHEEEYIEEEQKFSKGQSNEFDYDIMDRLEKSADIVIKNRKSDISYHGKDAVYIITLSDKKTKPTVEIKYSYTLHGGEAPFDKQLIRMFSVTSPTLDEDDLEDIYDACKKFIKI